MPKAQRSRSRQIPNTPVENLPAEFAAPTSDRNGASSRPTGMIRRPTYFEAVGRYEHGIRALQEHQFQEAAEAFRSVLAQYPEEKELNDRARLYLTLCERHLNSGPEPRTTEEHLYAATLALNAGDADTALRHLGAVVAQDPEHDGALYMLGIVHALKDDAAMALSYLERAIARNPENRALALQDADLERLLQDDSFRAALEAAGSRSADPRVPPRTRAVR